MNFWISDVCIQGDHLSLVFGKGCLLALDLSLLRHIDIQLYYSLFTGFCHFGQDWGRLITAKIKKQINKNDGTLNGDKGKSSGWYIFLIFKLYKKDKKLKLV